MWTTPSIRRNQVASTMADAEDLDRFLTLLPSPDPSSGHPFMSIDWLRKLLDAFLCCEDEFRATILMEREPSHMVIKPPLDRLIPELLDRTVKSLDVCNAISHGVESVRFVQKQAEIAVAALQDRPFTDGQIRRAKKALATVLSSIAGDEKESNASRSTKWNHVTSFRSLSWSVSRNWSAAKQIQAISSNLYPPRGVESSGLALPVHIMSVTLAFVMWALVAVIPCQERVGLMAHGPVPKQPVWAHGMSCLQERIVEEWKKKEKKGGAGGPVGLLEEVSKVEKAAQSLTDCLTHFRFPMEEEDEVVAHVAELEEICRRMEDGLGPLQRQLREVFHRIARCRVELLDVLDQAAKASTPSV